MKLNKAFPTVVLVLLFSVVAVARQQNQQTNHSKAGSTPSGAVPVLTIESFTHDFGEVKPGDPLRYAFKIKNEGKADLLINSVTPG